MSTARFARPNPDEYAPAYARYVDRVPAGDIADVLHGQVGDTLALLRGLPEDRAGFAYAPGKWTVKTVVGHVADVERVMAYRALSIGRGDAAPLPGFEENDWAPMGRFDDRSLDDLLDELVAARDSTVALLRGLPDDAWERRGVASEAPVSVRGLACIIAGHELHHRAVLRERYLLAPLSH